MAVLSDEVAAANTSDPPPRKKQCLSLSGNQRLRQTTLSSIPVNNSSGGNMSVTLNASKNGHEGRSEFSQIESRARRDRRTGYVSSRPVYNRDYQSSRLDSRSSGWSTRNETSGSSAVDSFEAMALAGYGSSETHNLIHSHNMVPIGGEDSPSSDTPPVATLCNLGNTCFLNSILYTLRFAPSFLHNLHHLVKDLGELNTKQQQCKAKSSSLGRNVSSSGRPWSGKDAFSLGNNSLHSSSSASDPALGKSRIQAASEKLHELYEAMHNAELKDSSDPFQPDVFLHALRDVNPIFEGNQQHDAHELLGCLLNIIRDTCLQLMKQVENEAEIPNGIAKPEEIRKEKETAPKSILSLSLPTHRTLLRSSWKKRKSPGVSSASKGDTSSVIEQVKPTDSSLNGSVSSGGDDPLLNSPTLSDKKSLVNGESSDHMSTESLNGTKNVNGCSLPTLHEGAEARSGLNFIADDFEGVSILQTTCLECECITEMKEAFCEINVPIPQGEDTDPDKPQGNVSDLYKSSVVTEELLHNGNKYWCEHCSRYNEARRSVRYESLPRLLTLQLKRFSSTFGSMVCMSKVNEYMPTPLSLDCFCQQCCRISDTQDGSAEPRKKHTYQLYSVIMHLGATMASGHYVAYVRATDPSTDYSNCDRDKRKTASLVSTGGKGGVTQNGDKPRRIMKRLFNKSRSNAASENVPKNHLIMQYYGNTCRSLDCCGVRVNRSVMVNDSSSSGEKPEPVWLECDDETIRVLSRRQFEEVLAPKPAKTSALTPYLLFYVRDP